MSLYECHITIEPISDETGIALIKELSKKYGFKLAELLMVKRGCSTLERSDKDTFITGHSVLFSDIMWRMKDLVLLLQNNGFKVWRYKVEEILVDSKKDDPYNLLLIGDKHERRSTKEATADI